MHKLAIAVAGVLIVLLTSSAWAADIFTPALPRGGAASRVNCRVLNTGSTTEQGVTVKLFNTFGVEQASLGPVDLESGTTTSVEDPTFTSAAYYCRVSAISRSRARVTLCMLDADDNCIVAVTATP